MRAGGLRHRIAIERDVGTESGSVGGRVEDWQPVITCRTRSAYKSGREFETARQISAEITELLVIRHDPRLEPVSGMQSMRVRFLDHGSTVSILYAADPTRRRREIHIHTCESH